MKLNKIVLPLALALAALVATTGCKHTPPKVTNIHGPAPTNPSSTQDLNTKPINPAETNPTPQPYTGGPIGTTATWDLTSMNQDPGKLAPYTVHFKYDSAVVEDSEQANVTSVSEALKSDSNAKLLIAGHCDERGTEEYNRVLGERRALALREALTKVGVDPMRIRTISYGKDQPVDSGHTEAAWAKNRRGQFIWCTPKMIAQ